MAENPDAQPAVPEDAALRTLKTRVLDKTYPTFSLARDLDAFLKQHPQSLQSLADKMEMSTRRPWLGQLLALLKRHEGDQANLEGRALSSWEVKNLLQNKPPQTSTPTSTNGTETSTTSTKTSTNGTDPSTTSTKTSTTSTNSENNQYNNATDPENDETPGSPDVEEVDSPMDRLKSRFQKKDAAPSRSSGKPVSILIMRALVGLFFGILELTFYLLSSRGYQAVVDLEKRAGDALEAHGPDKVTLWLAQFTVVVFCLFFFWPRIKQGIHWLRYPHETIKQNSSPASAVTPPPVTTAPISQPPVPESHPKKPVAAPVATPVVPVPVELHADVLTPDYIRLTWRAVGKDYGYNVYSSANVQLTNLRKENDHLLKSNVVNWTPETGLERYWVVVMAVDPQNHESGYSEAIEVVRHPEKSGSSPLLDQAAGAVRKVLPW